MHHIHDILISWGPLGLFLLAAIENAGPPTPGGTDWALVALAAARPEDAIMLAAVTVVGSLIGTAVFYEVMRRGGEPFVKRYTKRGRGKRFQGWFQQYGLVTVFISAMIPLPILPFKILAACAGATGVTRRRFMLVVVLARIPRYLGLAYLGQQLGENSKAWVTGHFWHLLAFAGVLAGALYALIRYADWKRERAVLQ